MMAIGGGVRGGIYGTAASLDPDPGNPTLENNGGDVRYETDFRSVYAACSTTGSAPTRPRSSAATSARALRLSSSQDAYTVPAVT